MSIYPFRLIPPVAAAFAVLYLSLIPDPPQPDLSLPFLDKIEHALAYALLGFLVFRIFRLQEMRVSTTLLIAFIICTVFGGMIEFFQQFTGRTPDGVDLLADSTGALLGFLVALPFSLRERKRY